MLAFVISIGNIFDVLLVAVHLRTVKLFDVEQVYLCESAIFCISQELIFAIVEELSDLLFLLGTKKVA